MQYISFSAMLYGKPVRVTAEIENVDIVTRDNGDEYVTATVASDLKDIEFEDVYDG